MHHEHGWCDTHNPGNGERAEWSCGGASGEGEGEERDGGRARFDEARSVGGQCARGDAGSDRRGESRREMRERGGGIGAVPRAARNAQAVTAGHRDTGAEVGDRVGIQPWSRRLSELDDPPACGEASKQGDEQHEAVAEHARSIASRARFHESGPTRMPYPSRFTKGPSGLGIRVLHDNSI